MSATVHANLQPDSPTTADPELRPLPLVLVVDDSSADRRLAGSLVEKRKGWRVAYAANGLEALHAIQRELPAIVLTDMIMPEMDGLGLVDTVRRYHPTLPVVVMTAHGSEDVAIQALRRGAVSYVPKKCLARDLGDTLDQVQISAHVDRIQQRLRECLNEATSHYILGNDPTLVPSLVACLQEQLDHFRLCDQTNRIRVGVALEEALLNGIYHGNLEVSSLLREHGDGPYLSLASERRSQSPYGERRLHVRAHLTRDEAVYVIQDEGPGFDPSTLPDPTDPANLERPFGRGLLLVRTFMDEVTFNDPGNQITLVKKREGHKACAF
jgi:CheY-like chemotaxis protein